MRDAAIGGLRGRLVRPHAVVAESVETLPWSADAVQLGASVVLRGGGPVADALGRLLGARPRAQGARAGEPLRRAPPRARRRARARDELAARWSSSCSWSASSTR